MLSQPPKNRSALSLMRYKVYEPCLVLGTLCLCLSSLTPSPLDAQELARLEPGELLADFVDQLHHVTSIHLEAQAIVKVEMDGVRRAGTGSYSYWEQGKSFRIRCETSKALGLLGDMEYTYDGTSSIVWLKDMNSLTPNVSIDREAPTALPNPFFLPVQFLANLDLEACPGCRVRLESLLKRRVGMVEESHGAGPRGATRSLVVRHRESAREYNIDLEHQQDMWVPTRIAWQDPTLKADITIVLRDYASEDAFLWPRSISWRAIGTTTDFSTRIDFLVTQLEYNSLFPKESFSSIGDANSVWLDDQRP